MQQNQTITTGSAKSMPCIDLPSILVSSDHSLSFKSFNSAADNRENNKPTEIRATVKSLINKFGSFQGNLCDNNERNFSFKKRPVIETAAGVKLCSPYSDYMNMEGDAVRVDDVKNTVRCCLVKIMNKPRKYRLHYDEYKSYIILIHGYLDQFTFKTANNNKLKLIIL